MTGLIDAVFQEIEDEISKEIEQAIVKSTSRPVEDDVLKVATKLSVIIMNNLEIFEKSLSETLSSLELSVAQALIASSFDECTNAGVEEAIEVVQEKEVLNALQGIYQAWFVQR